MRSHSRGRQLGHLSILLLSAATLAAVASSAAAAPGFTGGLEELPRGRLKSQIERLPPAAQQRALEWLQRFSIPMEDFDYLRVDPEGGVYYQDTELPEPVEEAEPVLPAQPEAVAPEQTFLLHSRPGAAKVVFLDFDGAVISGTAWNGGAADPLYARPYDTDGNPGSFGSAERAAIAEIWHRVAEDLAPFDIDVTTEDPGAFGPTVGHVLVTADSDANGAAMPAQGAGGVAYVGVWGRSDYHSKYQPALVYFDNLGNGFPPYVAEAASHEFGHNLALSHDGTNSQSYYSGHGAGYVSWAPIMGVGYYNNVTQWSKGEYPNANNQQDDLAIIAGQLGYRPDDHGGSLAGATPLQVDADGSVYVTFPEIDPDNLDPANKGVIETRSDTDLFWFDTGAGPLSFNVIPAWEAFYRGSRRGANLDIQARLYDAAGQLLASSDPLDDTLAQLAADLPAGRYYLEVGGVGNAGVPYSDYGSLGMYFISGSVQPATLDQTAPTPDPMGWALAPVANGASRIDMTALTASDASGVVRYWFQCVSGGGGCVDSGWQNSAQYSASGLSAGTSYSFRVKAADAAGNETAWSGLGSATTAANQAPVAVDDSAATDEDSAVLIAVLANDSDADGDPLAIASYGQGSLGAVSQNGTSLLYTPHADVSGTDSFSYSLSDGLHAPVSATVSVTIRPVNDAPLAADDSVDVAVNSSVVIEVLANDSDPEGDALSLQSWSEPGKGSLTRVGDTLVYQSGNKRGGDSFSYSIADSQGASATATVSIAISADGGAGGGGDGGGKCNPKKGC
ncbi:Ig-like domain-containing protein [Pseudomonas zhanjiangensis]|uniref:Ig-like domain-containing protein n=1 Tax=Pseudomonas zhanjiangensis TaxID=3239015 RepID=A0ABV3YV14_9PSED